MRRLFMCSIMALLLGGIAYAAGGMSEIQFSETIIAADSVDERVDTVYSIEGGIAGVYWMALRGGQYFNFQMIHDSLPGYEDTTWTDDSCHIYLLTTSDPQEDTWNWTKIWTLQGAGNFDTTFMFKNDSLPLMRVAKFALVRWDSLLSAETDIVGLTYGRRYRIWVETR